jgi:4-amino-4-deoxy-L-arabinose transferase-like glycosyltransferase
MELTPSHQDSRFIETARTSRSSTAIAAALAAAALGVFGLGLLDKSFVDEYAYITQSYYAELFLSGRTSDLAWLDVLAYDLQPLPKYLIGISLRLARLPMPRRADAMAWYWNYKPFGDAATLLAARLPSIVLGALGCVAILVCGRLIWDVRAGAIAAVLLILNPLYRLHAHRAMSDVPCEAFMLTALALSLAVWARLWSGCFGAAARYLPVLAGIAAGLALLCKFTGFLALLVIAAWCGLALFARGLGVVTKLAIAAATMLTIAVSLGTLVALNPFMTARPRGFFSQQAGRLVAQGPIDRFLFQLKHRASTSEDQQKNMPHNALLSLAERTKVFAVQGFGRFGPLGPSKSDSVIRYDLHQDLGMVLWLPCILFGVVQSVRLGTRQLRAGLPPTAIALVVWAALTWLVVTVYLPMAWDRYLLPIQSPNSLLAAVAMTALWDRVWSLRTGRPSAALETQMISAKC